MALQSNGSGFFSRSTNLPSNTTTWTVCFWVRITASTIGPVFCFDDNATGAVCNQLYYANVPGGASVGTQLCKYINGANTLVVDTGTNAWHFVAFRATAATTGSTAYRTESATSLTTATGLAISASTTMSLLKICSDGAALGHSPPSVELRGFKMWNVALTDAELMSESYALKPKKLASIDSWLPFYALDGNDKAGTGRNWTASGTPVLSSAEPRINAGGSGEVRIVLPSSLSALDCTVAASFTALTGAGTMRATNVATGAASFQALAGSGTMVATNVATGAASFTPWTAAGSAIPAVDCTVAGSFAPLTGAGTMKSTNVATCAGSFTALTGAGTMVASNVATGAGSFTAWTAAGTLDSSSGGTPPTLTARAKRRARALRRR